MMTAISNFQFSEIYKQLGLFYVKMRSRELRRVAKRTLIRKTIAHRRQVLTPLNSKQVARAAQEIPDVEPSPQVYLCALCHEEEDDDGRWIECTE